MAKFRKIGINFWKNPIVSEEMALEEKAFYVYLLSNHHTTQVGIYQITKKQMAFDLDISIERVQELIERFTNHLKLIRYNPVTRELAIKNWGSHNLTRAGKPMMDCLNSEFKKVQDLSLIRYVAEFIPNQEIRSLYESLFNQETKEGSGQIEKNTYIGHGGDELDDTLTFRSTIRGQEEDKEEEKEKQQTTDVQEIIEFWDSNGFGYNNLNGKEQLLSWLDHSHFLQPKEVILKAMNIACANNKRRLNYIVGILKNWENESLLTVEEIDSYDDKQKSVRKSRPATESIPSGRAIPGEFTLDLTAGEES